MGADFRHEAATTAIIPETRPGYTLPAVENPQEAGTRNKTINQAMGWQPVNLDSPSSR